MKITYAILGLTAGAALFLATGCGKEEQPSGATPKVTPPAASDTQKASEAPQPATEPAPAPAAAAADASQTNAPAAVPVAPPAMNTQVPGLIYNAKGLVANQKYQDALNVVQQLSGMNLTSDQQKQVDGLKAQIQAALAKSAAPDAGSALDNALGGKK